MHKLIVILLAMPILASAGFVKVSGTHFELDGARYSYLGTNFWYGMNLGVDGRSGDRPRLLRELDRLKAMGVTNLRVVAGSEGPDTEPWRIVPALQASPGRYSPGLQRGFDFLLSEMKKRDMRAVVCLNNFWPWSGGMSQYLRWSGISAIPYPPPAAGGSWTTYQKYTEKFYSNEKAVKLANNFIKMIVTRYAKDPTIMAWELANEPRGGGNTEAFGHWIEKTADLIKSLDKNHLVTTGSEGETPGPVANGVDFTANHAYKNIDYATAHIWAQNWGWYDPANAEQTYDTTVAQMKAYLNDHAEKAKKFGKPLVIEEFGLARDGGSFDPASATTMRDRYYREVFEEVYRAARLETPTVAGVNFWAWAGEGVPLKPFGGLWKRAVPFTGDPPHESQGWYSVYSTDQSTIKLLTEYAGKMSALH